MRCWIIYSPNSQLHISFLVTTTKPRGFKQHHSIIYHDLGGTQMTTIDSIILGWQLIWSGKSKKASFTSRILLVSTGNLSSDLHSLAFTSSLQEENWASFFVLTPRYCPLIIIFYFISLFFVNRVELYLV